MSVPGNSRNVNGSPMGPGAQDHTGLGSDLLLRVLSVQAGIVTLLPCMGNVFRKRVGKYSLRAWLVTPLISR